MRIKSDEEIRHETEKILDMIKPYALALGYLQKKAAMRRAKR